MTKGFANVIEDNQTEENYIIYAGYDSFPVAKNVQAIGFKSWLDIVNLKLEKV